MNDTGRNWLMVGIGFLVGTAGISALKSKPAHKLYVNTCVQGMKCKAARKRIAEEAKAQFDDIVAEADYKFSQQNDDKDAKAEQPAEAAAAKEQPAAEA